MTQTPPPDPGRPDPGGDVPRAKLEPARRSLMERVSVVWLVPLGALALALALAWQAYSDRGEVIVISFENGSGIAAGETRLKFRDIDVGTVERVDFNDDLSRVEVSVRIDAEVEPYIDGSAQFWIVRPEVTAEGIRGLTTVLSGVYIRGSWDGEPQGLVTEHAGLDDPPVAVPGVPGRRIVLRSEDAAGLTEGAPLIYRGLEAGRIGRPRLASDGITVIADAFVQAPYDAVLTDRTRFWNASGVSFDIGTSGASVNFASLATLIRGGLVFDTLVQGGAPAVDRAPFDIYADREAALDSLFDADRADRPLINVTAIFEDSATGLRAGAPVELNGLTIGEVSEIDGVVDPERFGDRRVRLVTTLSLRLGDLTMGEDMTPRAQLLAFLQERVRAGLRARLTTRSLLSRDLKVELVELPETGIATLDLDATPFPVLPTAPADIGDMADAAQGLLAQIQSLDIDGAVTAVTGFFEEARAVVADDSIRRVGDEVVGLVEEMRQVVGSEPVQALPGRVAATLDTFDGAVAEAQGVLAEMRAQETVATLTAALENAGAAADNIATAAEGTPDLVARLTDLADRAGALPLEDLVAEADGLVRDARAVVGSEAAQALPDRVAATLDGLDGAVAEAQGVLADLRAQETVATLTAALEDAGAAARDVSTAAEGAPALVERITALADTAHALALDELVAEATGLMQDARGLVADEATRALPADLRATLEAVDGATREAQAVLAALNEQDAAGSLSAALDGAARAADDVSLAVADVPGLVARIEAVAAKAEALALEQALEDARGLIGDTRAVIGTEAAQALPARIDATLAELQGAVGDARGVMADLEAERAVERLAAALEGAAQAADDVSLAVEGVPELVADIDAVVAQVGAQVDALELEPLIAEATALAESARGVLDTDAARALPARFGAALEELTAAVAELRQGGTVENVNATLASARRAADSVAESADSLPALATRTDGVLRQAEAVLAQFSEAGTLNREARAALRELAKAADAVRSLARTIERRPNALLTGR
jgi:paraquat-inducible protein B